jgi:hypothetical protein
MMIAHLALPCILSFLPIPQAGGLVAHDPASAAAEAGRRLLQLWSTEAAGPPGSVFLAIDPGAPESDAGQAEDSLRIRFAAEGIEVVRGGAGAAAVSVAFAADPGGEAIVVRVPAAALAVRVPFVRKPWVSGALARPGLLVVASDLHTSEADARRDAIAGARAAIARRLSLEARSGVPGASLTRRFRARIDREIARLLPAGTVPPGSVRDEFVEPRTFSVGPMTRVHLLMDLGGKWFRDAQRRVQRAGRSVSHELVLRVSAIAIGWAVLFFIYAVLDRLTRGYLTGRLRLISGGLGLLLLFFLWWA